MTTRKVAKKAKTAKRATTSRRPCVAKRATPTPGPNGEPGEFVELWEFLHDAAEYMGDALGAVHAQDLLSALAWLAAGFDFSEDVQGRNDVWPAGKVDRWGAVKVLAEHCGTTAEVAIIVRDYAASLAQGRAA